MTTQVRVFYILSMALIFAVLLVGCGSGSSGQTDTGTLRLAISNNASGAVTAIAGTTTYVQVLALGGSGSPSFGAVDLPDFATLDADGLLELRPMVEQIGGSFAFTLTAIAGAQSASLPVNLAVARDNTAPIFEWPTILDGRGMIVRWLPSGSCELDVLVNLAARDAEGDPIRIEIEVVPVGAALSGQATHTAPAKQPTGPAQRVFFDVVLTGLLPGQAYFGAGRAIDAVGAASPWQSLTPSWNPDSFTCHAP